MFTFIHSRIFQLNTSLKRPKITRYKDYREKDFPIYQTYKNKYQKDNFVISADIFLCSFLNFALKYKHPTPFVMQCTYFDQSQVNSRLYAQAVKCF